MIFDNLERRGCPPFVPFARERSSRRSRISSRTAQERKRGKRMGQKGSDKHLLSRWLTGRHYVAVMPRAAIGPLLLGYPLSTYPGKLALTILDRVANSRFDHRMYESRKFPGLWVSVVRGRAATVRCDFRVCLRGHQLTGRPMRVLNVLRLSGSIEVFNALESEMTYVSYPTLGLELGVESLNSTITWVSVSKGAIAWRRRAK